jgi:hypothetical protein
MSRPRLIAFAITGTFLVGAFIAGIVNIPPSDWRTDDDRVGAIYAVQDVIENKLLDSPGSAKFPWTLETAERTKSLGEQRYSVTSYVDSQNGLGALVRTDFKAEVQQVAKDKWQLRSIRMWNHTGGEELVNWKSETASAVR